MTMRTAKKSSSGRAGIFQRLFRMLDAESGSAIVELAVAIPILLLLAIGVGDFARIYYAAITVANAARAGAQYGAQYGSHSPGNTTVMNAGARAEAGTFALDSVSSARVCRCADGTVVDCVTGNCGSYGVPQVFDSVRVRSTVRFIIRYPGIADSVIIIRTAVFRAQ
jgi:Flp pilus assembly protein TadG